jgi:hypothetical protein
MKRWMIVSRDALGLATLAAAESLTLTVHTDKVANTVGAGIYVQFLEHIFHSLHGGLWGHQKVMLELPGRIYDLLRPGWQQEDRRTGPGARGIGAHRTRLPWISVNHLLGITGSGNLDMALYLQLAVGNSCSHPLSTGNWI